MRRWTDRQTHRRPWPLYISPLLRLARNVINKNHVQRTDMNELRHFNFRRVTLHKILKSSLVVAVKKTAVVKLAKKTNAGNKRQTARKMRDAMCVHSFIYPSVVTCLLYLSVSLLLGPLLIDVSAVHFVFCEQVPYCLSRIYFCENLQTVPPPSKTHVTRVALTTLGNSYFLLH